MAQVAKVSWIDQLDAVRSRLGRLVHEFAEGLEALHRVQFDEPWKQMRRPMHGEW